MFYFHPLYFFKYLRVYFSESGAIMPLNQKMKLITLKQAHSVGKLSRYASIAPPKNTHDTNIMNIK